MSESVTKGSSKDARRAKIGLKEGIQRCSGCLISSVWMNGIRGKFYVPWENVWGDKTEGYFIFGRALNTLNAGYIFTSIYWLDDHYTLSISSFLLNVECLICSDVYSHLKHL